jgi:peptidoglycan-associated lipoprotein
VEINQALPGHQIKKSHNKNFILKGEQKMKQYLMPGLTIILISILMLTISCASNKGAKQSKSILETEEGQIEEGQIAEDQLDEGVLAESEVSAAEFKEVSERASELTSIFTDINFDYDSFALNPQAKTILDRIAETLLSETALQLMIEGHCDDRGTNEYNLALGQRRAESAKKYLTQLGISSERIFTISYGEEKPLNPNQGEEAWAENRRDHFMIR